MKLLLLFITLNFYTLTILSASAPKPLKRPEHPLHLLTNMACKVSMLLKMRTPLAKTDYEDAITLALEPGKNTSLNFAEKESFFLHEISVRPERNLPSEYTEGSHDASLPEYKNILKEPPVIGTKPLVLTINETYKVKGYIEEQGVLFVHYITCMLQKTGRPLDNPIFDEALSIQT